MRVRKQANWWYSMKMISRSVYNTLRLPITFLTVNLILISSLAPCLLFYCPILQTDLCTSFFPSFFTSFTFCVCNLNDKMETRTRISKLGIRIFCTHSSLICSYKDWIVHGFKGNENRIFWHYSGFCSIPKLWVKYKKTRCRKRKK